MKNNWKDTMKYVWQEWGKPFLIVAIIVVSFRSAVADWNDVPTGSMKPTILEGDRIFVNKMAYGLRIPLTMYRLMQWEGPEHGDIVVCFSPYDGIRLVKRVVGVPGDSISYKKNQLCINGSPMKYSDPETNAVPSQYIENATKYRYSQEKLGNTDHLVMTHSRPGYNRPFGPVTLGDDEYFMMGDNRDESFDSRYFGIVKRESIIGKVKGVALSLDPGSYYAPRWDRFFSDIH